MKAKITEIEETLFVEGSFDSKSENRSKSQLEYLKELCDSFRININGKDYPNTNGKEVVEKLFDNSIPSNKPFFIIGQKLK